MMKRSSFLRGSGATLAGLGVLVFYCGPAWAGIPVPAPLAGAAGPVGLLIAGVAYGGYRLVKYLRKRR